jgi:hypothetical protein
MFQLFRVPLEKPRSEQRKVLALQLFRKGKEAMPGFAAASRRTTTAWPAVSSRVVDQVVKGQLGACLDMAQCDDVDSIGTEAEVGVRVARVVEVPVGASHQIDAAIDERAMLGTFTPFGTKR